MTSSDALPQLQFLLPDDWIQVNLDQGTDRQAPDGSALTPERLVAEFADSFSETAQHNAEVTDMLHDVVVGARAAGGTFLALLRDPTGNGLLGASMTVSVLPPLPGRPGTNPATDIQAHLSQTGASDDADISLVPVAGITGVRLSRLTLTPLPGRARLAVREVQYFIPSPNDVITLVQFATPSLAFDDEFVPLFDAIVGTSELRD